MQGPSQAHSVSWHCAPRPSSAHLSPSPCVPAEARRQRPRPFHLPRWQGGRRRASGPAPRWTPQGCARASRSDPMGKLPAFQTVRLRPERGENWAWGKTSLHAPPWWREARGPNIARCFFFKKGRFHIYSPLHQCCFYCNLTSGKSKLEIRPLNSEGRSPRSGRRVLGGALLLLLSFSCHCHTAQRWPRSLLASPLSYRGLSRHREAKPPAQDDTGSQGQATTQTPP